MKQGDAACHDQRAEAALRRSAHEDAISESQPQVREVCYHDAYAIVLDKQCCFVPAEVGNCGFERDLRLLAGLSVGKVMNGAEGS